MLGGFVSGLIVAWILSWFNVDSMIINSAREMFQASMSISSYYVCFGLLGAISGAFRGQRSVNVKFKKDTK